MFDRIISEFSYFVLQNGITLNDVVLAVAVLFFVVGARSILLYAKGNRAGSARIKNKRLRQLIDGLKNDSSSELFMTLGININIQKYNSIRMLALLFCSLLAVISAIRGRGAADWIVFTGLLAYATYPKEELFGKMTPFKWVMEKAKTRYLKKRDEEISRIITQLKNLIVAQGDKPWSADYIIESLMRFAEITKPIFVQTLRIHREGRVREACEYFAATTATRLGRDFATVLLKLDELNPTEFLYQLTMFQADIKEKKQTERIKSQKAMGSFLFLATMIVCGVIVMDGMYVIMLHDALSRLNMI